jgi:hypothetical protein
VIFDPVQAINLVIYAVVSLFTTFGAAAKVYYGLRSEVREVKQELVLNKETNDLAHKRIEDDIRDHEVRIRVVERTHG